MKQGKFIVIEGIDGAGKTTQVSAMAEMTNCLVTKQPSQLPIGGLIRDILGGRGEDDLSPSSEQFALMWAADRLAQQEHEIIPEMLRGRSVICDRWYHSSIAYQAGGVVTQEWIRNINRHALTPDLTIFLEVTPETARQRIANRAEGRGIFDDHLDRVSDGYRRSVDLLRRHQENILILDGANDRADISAQILSAIRHICRN